MSTFRVIRLSFFLALSIYLGNSGQAGAQVYGGYYNPYTGGYYQGASGYNPYTGRYAPQGRATTPTRARRRGANRP